MGEIDDGLEIAEAGLVVERKDDGVVLDPHDLALGYGRYQRLHRRHRCSGMAMKMSDTRAIKGAEGKRLRYRQVNRAKVA